MEKLPGGAEEIYFYSIMGERWGAYQPIVSGPSLYLKRNSESLFYAGTMIRSQGQAVVMDRLGSVRSFGGTSIRYFPYGEEQTSTANEKNKFGTYFRDGTTGLDYAEQRYYASGIGRFLSTDPYQPSGRSENPGSWNRFPYVIGDPVNLFDRRGLDYTLVPGQPFNPSDPRNAPPVVVTVRPGRPGSRRSDDGTVVRFEDNPVALPGGVITVPSIQPPTRWWDFGGGAPIPFQYEYAVIQQELHDDCYRRVREAAGALTTSIQGFIDQTFNPVSMVTNSALRGMVIGAYQAFTGTGFIVSLGVEVSGAAGMLYGATVGAVYAATVTAIYLPITLWAAPPMARAIAAAAVAEITNPYLAECDSRYPVTTSWP